MTTTEDIRRFLVDAGAPVGDIAEDAPLFSTGRVDSFLLADLLLFLEQASGSRLDPARLKLQDVDSLEGLTRLARGGG